MVDKQLLFFLLHLIFLIFFFIKFHLSTTVVIYHSGLDRFHYSIF